MKAYAFVHNIINYTTKRGYGQYQRIMATAIGKKTFKDWNKPGPKPLFYMPILDKFLFKAFNRLSHNCKISRPIVIKFLLVLPDHYIFNAFIKSINIFVLKTKFLLLISR